MHSSGGFVQLFEKLAPESDKLKAKKKKDDKDWLSPAVRTKVNLIDASVLSAAWAVCPECLLDSWSKISMWRSQTFTSDLRVSFQL